jgi:hypothetical protein
MRKVILVAVAAAALLTAPYFASARDFSTSGEYHGGSDIGPLGQCFNPPDCGRHDNINGRGPQGCPLVRERIVISSGHVIYRRRHACY